jgi:hypothetical protein
MTTAIESFMDVCTSMITTITGNATLMVFFCSGLAFTAVGLVKRLRG